MANIHFNNRHSFEEWLYLHVYNMMADDYLDSQNGQEFNTDLCRQMAKKSAKTSAQKYSYVTFCIEGFSKRNQIQMVNDAYDNALQYYFEDTRQPYIHSRQ